MKNRFLKCVILAGLVLPAFIFTGCKKDVDTNYPNIPAAGLMAFNLVPDNGAVGFDISGNTFTRYPLLYTSFTGGYQAVYTGNRQVTSYNANSGNSLASVTQLFADSAYYSVFALGANGKYRNVIVKDNLDSLPAATGEAFVRFVNAIADTVAQPLVTITSGATNIFHSNASFGAVSDFKGVSPGSLAIQVSNQSNINASRTFTLETGKIYTVLLTGIPGQADSTKAVQIKYIQNGAVTPNQ